MLRNGKPFLALGSPGGASIITTVAQILVNRLDFGMSLPDAVAALRLSQRNSATTQSEPGFDQTPEYAPLVARGQKFAVTTTPASSQQIGAATGIEFLGHGQVQVAAEPTRRGGGSAAVVSAGGPRGPRGHDGRHRSHPPHDFAKRAGAASRAPRRSERAAPDQGLAERDLVGVLEVGADRQAGGQARDRDVGRALAQARGDVQRRGLAGRGRVGGEHHLA